MKPGQLTGPQLAEWVARANGWKVARDGIGPDAPLFCEDDKGEPFSFAETGYRPDMNWGQCGPIIEAEGIYFEPAKNPANGVVFAHYGEGLHGNFGANRREASMRAYVERKFGLDLPDVVEFRDNRETLTRVAGGPT